MKNDSANKQVSTRPRHVAGLFDDAAGVFVCTGINTRECCAERIVLAHILSCKPPRPLRLVVCGVKPHKNKLEKHKLRRSEPCNGCRRALVACAVVHTVCYTVPGGLWVSRSPSKLDVTYDTVADRCRASGEGG